MEELKNFRQLHSKSRATRKWATPQVWKPLLVRWSGYCQRSRYGDCRKNAGGAVNRPGHDIVDHYTYAFMGDGS